MGAWSGLPRAEPLAAPEKPEEVYEIWDYKFHPAGDCY